MPGKANTYTLGEFGVNRVKSPIHMIDGELLVAQNAEVPFVTGNRGLRKRSGMAKATDWRGAGAILSMINVPLPDPLPLDFDPAPHPPEPLPLAGDIYLPSGGGWMTSTDGIAFHVASPAPAVIPTNNTDGTAIVSHRGRMYFMHGPTAFKSFDNTLAVTTNGTLSLTISRPTLAVDPTTDMIFGANESSGSFSNTAFRYDIGSGTLTTLPFTVGPGFVQAISIGAVDGIPFVGDLFGGIYSHNGTDWSAESLAAANVSGKALAFATTLDGRLFAGMSNTSGGAAKSVIIKRESGVWSSVVTGPNGDQRDMLVVMRDGSTLYATNSATRLIYKSDDGTTWVLDEDLSASLTSMTDMIPWNDDLLVLGTAPGSVARTMRRDSGGVWSAVADLAGIGVGPSGGHV